MDDQGELVRRAGGRGVGMGPLLRAWDTGTRAAASLPPTLPQVDLIGKAKETGKDVKLRRLLHQQWEQQQDDKELAQVMAGLKNGFRRKRAGFLGDDDVSGAAAGAMLGAAAPGSTACCCAPTPDHPTPTHSPPTPPAGRRAGGAAAPRARRWRER